jgi:hypothetical protein
MASPQHLGEVSRSLGLTGSSQICGEAYDVSTLVTGCEV